MALYSARVVLLTAALGLTACFDPGDSGSSGTDTATSSTTTGGTGDCEPGFPSCPCLPNGTCNVGLVCEAGTVCKPDTGTTTTESTTAPTTETTTDPTTDPTTGPESSTSTTDSTSSADSSSSTGSSSSESTGSGLLTDHRIFISSVTFAPNFGSVDGADDDCQSLADAEALGGTWRAVLRDDASDFSDRITINGPVLNLSGETVAADADEFFGGTAQNAVSTDETGDAPADTIVWVGTQAAHCVNWTSNNSGQSAGQANSTNLSGWLIGVGTGPCTLSRSIYCIDQDP